jgi:hypothetical protein
MWQDELKKAIAIERALRSLEAEAKKLRKQKAKINIHFKADEILLALESQKPLPWEPTILPYLYLYRDRVKRDEANKLLCSGMQKNCPLRIAAAMIFRAATTEQAIRQYFNRGLYHQDAAQLCCAMLMGANPTQILLESEVALRWADRRIDYRPMSALMRGWLQHLSQPPARIQGLRGNTRSR